MGGRSPGGGGGYFHLGLYMLRSFDPPFLPWADQLYPNFRPFTISLTALFVTEVE